MSETLANEPFEVEYRSTPIFQTGYDGPDRDQSTVSITAAADAEPVLKIGEFLRTSGGTGEIDYVLRVTEGPYFPPPFESNSRPKSVYRASIVGQDVDNALADTLSGRPRPRLVVKPLETSRSNSIVGAEGDLKMGVLHTDPTVVVGLASEDKRILPRNVGVFGTVGSGKSNTTQVLVEEASAAGWAVVVIDVEGEYVKIGQAAKSDAMGSAGPDPERPPRGLDDVQVLLPATKKRGKPKGARLFTVPASGFPLELLGGLIEVSEAQRRLLHRAAHTLPDGYSLEELIAAVTGVWLDDGRQGSTREILLNRLELLARTGLFDDRTNRQVVPLDVDELVAPGRVTVIDVSDLNDRTRNLTLGYVLQSLFQVVEGVARGKMHTNGPRPPVMLVMEEVQTFFGTSDETKEVVLSFLQEVARRGRKRWLSLVAVSQQPSALPAGFFELLNTRIVHQTSSQPNLTALRRSCGDIRDDTWKLVTRLGPGQCILSGPAVRNAEIVQVRPASSQRLLTA